MLRGEDIAELQRSLGSLGFNAGKVDGIFGPDTQNAVELFQRNSGLVVDAIFGPNCITALKRLGERVEQSSVAVVQEKEKIISKMRSNDLPSIALGHLGVSPLLLMDLRKRMRQSHIKVDVIGHYDESVHAAFCNKNNIDLYIGIFPPLARERTISFYSAKGFASPGGKHFTVLFSIILLRQTEKTIETIGNSEKVLRETRMPAVAIRYGSTEDLITDSQMLLKVLTEAISSGFLNLLSKILTDIKYSTFSLFKRFFTGKSQVFPKLGITNSEQPQSLNIKLRLFSISHYFIDF